MLSTDFPFASVQDSYLEVTEGQNASLVRFVSGTPLPDITWRNRMDAVLQNTGEIFLRYVPACMKRYIFSYFIMCSVCVCVCVVHVCVCVCVRV